MRARACARLLPSLQRATAPFRPRASGRRGNAWRQWLPDRRGDGPFVDGVVDIQSDVHRLLDGPRVVRNDDGSVTIIRLDDVLG